jgi:hypothetical protein
LHSAEELKAAQPNAELLVIAGADHTFGSSQPYTGTTLPPYLHDFCNASVKFLKK